MWLVVNKDGTEYAFNNKPSKVFNRSVGELPYWAEPTKYSDENYYEYEGTEMPEGSIKKLIGRKLTWEDEPYEYT